MKKFLLMFTMLVGFALTGCSSTVTNQDGVDITDLDSCIDDMTNDMLSTSCTDRSELMEAYVHTYESYFDITDSVYNDSDFEFSSNRDSTELRLRYWFQYTMLDDTQTLNNYDTYKDIVQAILVDLNSMNEFPTYQVEGEFFHLNGHHYIFETDLNESLTGEIQIYDTLVTIDVAVSELQVFIDSYSLDQELEKQTFQLMALDHAVIVVVDVPNSSYQYKIFRTTNEDTNTILQVETMIETVFNSEGVTLEVWTID